MKNWMGAAYTAGASSPDPPYIASLITPLNHKLPMVAAADVGAALARQLLQTGRPLPSSPGPYAFDLWGPEDYSPRDVQRAVEAVVGKPVEVRPVEKDQLHDFFLGPPFSFDPGTAAEWPEMTASMLPGGILAESLSEPLNLIRGKTTLAEGIRALFSS